MVVARDRMAILNCVVKRGVVVVGLVGIGNHVAVILEMGMALDVAWGCSIVVLWMAAEVVA